MTAPPTPNGRERAQPRGAADSVLPSRSFWSSTGRGVRRPPPGQLGVSSRGPVPPREAPATPGGGAFPGSQPSHLDRGGKGPSSRLRLPEPPGPGVQWRSWGGPSGTAESSPGDSAVGARGICAPARAGFDSPEIHRPPQAGHTVRGRWWGHRCLLAQSARPAWGRDARPALRPRQDRPRVLVPHTRRPAACTGTLWEEPPGCEWPSVLAFALWAWTTHPDQSPPPRPARRSREARLRLLTPLQASPKA